MDDSAACSGLEPTCTPSHLPFPVVGLGASAGGLAALARFFEAAPANLDMAFVVILHLSPRHASQADKLLAKATTMPVRQVREPTRLEPNHIYVIAPSLDLSMNDGYLRVTEARRPLGRHVAIDLFFRTLALVHRDRAFAVVLSGSGADGATGITRVKEQGGVTLAQSPLDSEHDGMPRAAIATGMIDWVLPVADMPQKLLELWQNVRRMHLPALPPDDGDGAPGQASPPATERDAREAEEALVEIMVLLRTRTGHDFRHYKRATVLRRLERRMQVHAVPDLPAYRSLLRNTTEETQALLKDLLIGVTNFFRDRAAFDALERTVVPELFGPGHAGTLRAWAAGCATGEEAYSIAMLLAEHADGTPDAARIQVFATDIDEQAIAAGREASYPESIVADVPASRLRRWFTRDGHRYRLRQELRERVLFAAHNVLRDPPFSKLDLVSCRNLLIYLDRRVQAEVLELFHFALRPGGYLFLGSSETADAAEGLFSVVDKQHRIFRANPVKRPARTAVSLAEASG